MIQMPVISVGDIYNCYENCCGLPVFIIEENSEFQFEDSENKEVISTLSKLMELLTQG